MEPGRVLGFTIDYRSYRGACNEKGGARTASEVDREAKLEVGIKGRCNLCVE